MVNKNRGLIMIGCVGIILSIFVLFIIYGTSKMRAQLIINVKANETQLETISKQSNDNITAIDKALEITNEENMRHQMRLNLKAIGDVLQKDIESKNFDDRKTLIDYIRNRVSYLTESQRTFSEEGDWFTLLTIGPYTYFIETSPDCAQPIVNGRYIIQEDDRVKSIYDEVIWQREARVVLSMYGLIEVHSYQNIPSSVDFIGIDKSYAIDSKLNNLEVIRYEDVNYIKTKYPVVYDKLKNLKIIMHSDEKMAEDIMTFIQYHKATSPGDNLYWQFNQSPRKEILEVYVIPPGTLGVNNERRMLFGGIYNENYIKISLVSGCQIYDVNESYNKVKKLITTSIYSSQNITQIRDNIKITNRLIKYLDYLSIFTVCIVLASVVFGVISYRHIPKQMLDESYFQDMCHQHCQRGNKEEGSDSIKK